MKKVLLLSAAAVALSASAISYPKGEAFAYNFAEGFAFEQAQLGDAVNAQYPLDGLQGGASLDEGWGTASIWFNAKHFDGETGAEDMNAYAPVVEYPAGDKAVKIQTTTWDGFGNVNFAMPQGKEGKKYRIRVIFMVDVTGKDYPTAFDGKRGMQVKLMDDADQDNMDYAYVGTGNLKGFWDNPGWRVFEFESALEHDHYYISILYDAGGLTCSADIPTYIREVSVVETSLIENYTQPEVIADINDNILGYGQMTVAKEVPELVTISEGAGVESVAVDANAPVEYFNLQGIRVAEPANGIFIRRQGSTTRKVVL